jgi:HK97 gp10 family phage protein
MRLKVDVIGEKETISWLNSLSAEKQNRVRRVVMRHTIQMEGIAIARAPVSPIAGGNLKNSIYHKFEDKGFTGEVHSPAKYSAYQEYGTGIYAEKGGRKTPWIYRDPKTGQFVLTRGNRPQKFMRPAFESTVKKFRPDLRKALRG